MIIFFLIESDNTSLGTCKEFNKDILKKCQIVGPPISLDYPVHPFFLSASRNPVKK